MNRLSKEQSFQESKKRILHQKNYLTDILKLLNDNNFRQEGKDFIQNYIDNINIVLKDAVI